MAINGVGLYFDAACTQPLITSNGKFIITGEQIFDFGKVRQIWLRNEFSDRNLKDEYILIIGDSTDAIYNKRMCKLSNYDGSNKTTTGKLYLKNNSIPPLGSEMFQIHFEPLLGVNNQNGLVLQIVASNHEVNIPQYQII